jgi:hypothetical protein
MSSMYQGKDTSKRLGPTWAAVAGVALLATACALLVLLVIGLRRGEIWAFSHSPGLVLREKSPGAFWSSAALSLIFGVWLSFLSLRLLNGAFQQLRR